LESQDFGGSAAPAWIKTGVNIILHVEFNVCVGEKIGGGTAGIELSTIKFDSSGTGLQWVLVGYAQHGHGPGRTDDYGGYEAEPSR
jgi:hypothetical protein